MEDYTFEELADMHCVYGEVGCDDLVAEKLYRKRYPKRRHPSGQVFALVAQQLRETGSLRPRREGCGNGRSTGTTDFEKENAKDTIPEINMNPVSVQESEEVHADDIEIINTLESKLPKQNKKKLLGDETGFRKKRLQIMNLEKQFFEEKIITEREKSREAKARADLAELELQEFRKKI